MEDVEQKSLTKTIIYGDFELFVDTILFPEVIAIVMAKVFGCNVHAGLHMAWLSEPFGLKEFPSDNDCSILKRVQNAPNVVELRRQYDSGEEAFLRLRSRSLGPM